MNHRAESGSARPGGTDCSRFLERDLHGPLLGIRNAVERSLGQEAQSLLMVQSRFVRHYFQLQLAASVLTQQTQGLRRGGRSVVVHQIEMERERLARELHTGVGQLLAAIRLQLEVAARLIPDPPEAIAGALQRIGTLAADALDQVRSVSRRLHPPEWQRLSLVEALRQLWDLSGVPQRFEAFLRLDTLPREPDQDIRVLVYRTAQEALSNLARYSQATVVSMMLEPAGVGQLVLTVQDDGAGFDVASYLAAPAKVASGIGLRSIREQAASLGAAFDITSGPQGTTLKLSAPYEAREE